MAVSRSVYSWYRDYMYDGYFEEISDLLFRYMITSVYQYIDLSDLSNERFVEYAEKLYKSGVKLYIIYDEQEMDKETFTAFLEELSPKAEELHIRGIVTDVEPLSGVVADRKAILQDLTAFLEFCSHASHNSGLEIIHSIPVWYDGISEELAERIIASSDRIADELRIQPDKVRDGYMEWHT